MTEPKISKTFSVAMPFLTRCRSLPDTRGFTLVELLVSVAIIGVLASFSAKGFGELKEKAKISRASSEIRNLEKDISAFAIEKGYYPPNGLVDIGKGGMLDPWGRAYEYKRYVITEMRSIGPIELNSDFDLYSKGMDGLSERSIEDPASADDISRLRDGSFVGTSESFMN